VAGVTPASLVTGDHTVVLDPAAADVDVAAFERAVAEGTPEALERAATFYRGDLLEGLGVTSEPFEEWLLTEREAPKESQGQAVARGRHHKRIGRSGSLRSARRGGGPSRTRTLDPLIKRPNPAPTPDHSDALSPRQLELWPEE
jgi:hypothetical protein